MLPVQPLRDQFAKLVRSRGNRGGGCSTLMQRAFCRVPFTAARQLIEQGLHPAQVTRHWSDGILCAIPEKAFLLLPKHIPFGDLLLAVERLSNAAHYAQHVQYHRQRLIYEADLRTLLVCVPHMTLFDDDLRCLMDRFSPTDSARIMARASATSMYTMSYIYEDDVAEDMLLHNPCVREALYEHQRFSSAFLTRMFFMHGIAPTNDGIGDGLTPAGAVDILAGITCGRAASGFLYALDARIAASTAVKNFVLVNIMNGCRLDHYGWYARTHLRDRVSAMHVYARIYFKTAEVNLAEYTMTRERLANICAYVQFYADQLDFIVGALLRFEYYDLLAPLLPRAPACTLSEDVVLRAIRDAPAPVPVSALRVRSTCVIVQCIMRGCEDVVDFLDVASADVLVSYGANLFTDYCFSTEWFNRDVALLHLFVRRFGYCGPMMRKLLFEYPLSTEAAMTVLDIMVDNPGMAMFEPTQMCELGYLACTTSNFRLRTTRRTVTLRYTDALREDVDTLLFESEVCCQMSMALQALGVSQLKTCEAHDLSLSRHMHGVYLQFARAARSWATAGDWLCAQLYDVCVLAKHGLFHIPMDHLPAWTPVLDAARGRSVMPPSCFCMSIILPLDFTQLVRYEDLGNALSIKMQLEDVASNYHAAINVLMSTLMVYLVVGSTMLERDDAVPAYVSSVTAAFVRGLKINGVISESSLETHEELTRFRAESRSRTGSILVQSPDAVSHTLRHCTDLCVAAVLDNN